MARPREPLDPALPVCLADPSAYPDDASAAAGIEQIQTHLSYVFLTGERVYKVRTVGETRARIAAGHAVPRRTTN